MLRLLARFLPTKDEEPLPGRFRPCLTPLDTIKECSGIDAWCHSKDDAYVLDLSHAKINANLVIRLGQVLSYQFLTLTDSGAKACGLSYTSEDSLAKVLKWARSLIRSGDRMEMPRPGPGYASSLVLEVLDFLGDVQDGEYGGPKHIATRLEIKDHFAHSPEFQRIMRESRAVREAFLPIRKELHKQNKL